MNKLILLPTGYTVPDCPGLTTAVVDETDGIQDLFSMHNPTFIMDLNRFYKDNNVKRFLELEGIVSNLINASNKIAFKDFIGVISLFNKMMDGITTHDWFDIQFKSNTLSNIDKDFLIRFASLASYKEDPFKTYITNTYNELSVYLNIPSNRVKGALLKVDTKVVEKCIYEYRNYKTCIPTTWDKYIVYLFDTYGSKGFDLFLLLARMIFVTGYTEKGYKGG